MWRNVMTRVVIITTTTMIIIVTLAEDHLIPSVGLGGHHKRLHSFYC